jgi:signal transduction histidine kinase
MNRIEAGRMSLKDEPFSLQEMLSHINVMFRSQCEDKGLSFDSRIIGEPENALRGDEVKLKRVLINILGNAVKFTNAPGTVTFTTEQTARTEETAGSRRSRRR